MPHKRGIPRKDAAGMAPKLFGISPVRLLKETFRAVRNGMVTSGSSDVKRLPSR